MVNIFILGLMLSTFIVVSKCDNSENVKDKFDSSQPIDHPEHNQYHRPSSDYLESNNKNNHRRPSRSLADSNLLLKLSSLLKKRPLKGKTTDSTLERPARSVNYFHSGISDPKVRVRRQENKNKAEKYANKAAGYIQQGSAAIALASQLGASVVEMQAHDGADAVSEGAHEMAQQVSDGFFKAGQSLADTITNAAKTG